jgi:nicotinamidase-related amidase
MMLGLLGLRRHRQALSCKIYKKQFFRAPATKPAAVVSAALRRWGSSGSSAGEDDAAPPPEMSVQLQATEKLRSQQFEEFFGPCGWQLVADTTARGPKEAAAAAKTALFLCDMQSKFSGVIHSWDSVVCSSRLLLRAAKELGMPVVATEQYPRGLGHTIPELASELILDTAAAAPGEDGLAHSSGGGGGGQHLLLEKLSFSMLMGSADEDSSSRAALGKFMGERGVTTVLLCGVEAHVCVLQTALELLAQPHVEVEVVVVVDAVSSRRLSDRDVALHRLQEAGATLTSAEAAIFSLLGSASHSSFRQVSKLVQEPRVEAQLPGGGLLGL